MSFLNNAGVTKLMQLLKTALAAKANTADLGELASVDYATGMYKPSGQITITPVTLTIPVVSNVGSASRLTYNSSTQGLNSTASVPPTVTDRTYTLNITATFDGTIAEIGVSAADNAPIAVNCPQLVYDAETATLNFVAGAYSVEQITNVTTTIAQLESQKRVLAEANATLTSQNSALQNQNSSLNNANATLTAQKEALQSQNTSLQNTINNAENTLSTLVD